MRWHLSELPLVPNMLKILKYHSIAFFAHKKEDIMLHEKKKTAIP